MKARLIAAASAVAAAAVVTGGIVLSSPASAVNTTLCDQYASTKIQGGAYIAMNNRWGTSGTQCIDVTDDGFTITQQDGVNPTNGAPTAYPSVYWGCHYNNCTNNFSPIRANTSAFDAVSTKATFKSNGGGSWNASYDIWFDPTARRDGQNTGAEVMVWANHSGPPQPVGSKVGTVTLAGASWDVWYGNSGWNVISYVRTSAATTLDFKVADFFDDVVRRGYGQDSWYLTSVQAGFEPWSGGKGLALSGFGVTQSSGGGSTQPQPQPSVTVDPVIPTPTPSQSTTAPTEPGTGTGAAKCTAVYKVAQSWNGGFLGEVTVKNTGGTATKNWKVDWSWPAGQKVVSSWNASAAQTGTKVTADSLTYNSGIAAGSTAAFGMQVSGASATPTLTCGAS